MKKTIWLVTLEVQTPMQDTQGRYIPKRSDTYNVALRDRPRAADLYDLELLHDAVQYDYEYWRRHSYSPEESKEIVLTNLESYLYNLECGANSWHYMGSTYPHSKHFGFIVKEVPILECSSGE